MFVTQYESSGTEKYLRIQKAHFEESTAFDGADYSFRSDVIGGRASGHAAPPGAGLFARGLVRGELHVHAADRRVLQHRVQPALPRHAALSHVPAQAILGPHGAGDTPHMVKNGKSCCCCCYSCCDNFQTCTALNIGGATVFKICSTKRSKLVKYAPNDLNY